MLPMTEPVTELTLEAPAGLIRVTRRVPRRQGRRRDVPQRAGVRDPPRRAGRGAAPRARSPSTSPTAGCSTSSPTPSAFGLRLTPDEGADIVRITEMIKAAADRAAAGRPPGAARVRRHHDRPAVRAGPRSGEQPAERRDGLDRDARLGAPGDLDRRDRPLAVRHRDLGQDGDAARARASSRSATTFRHEGILGTVFTGRLRRGDARSGRTGRSSRRSPVRPGSPGSPSYVVDPTDPFPDGFTIGDIWA